MGGYSSVSIVPPTPRVRVPRPDRGERLGRFGPRDRKSTGWVTPRLGRRRLRRRQHRELRHDILREGNDDACAVWGQRSALCSGQLLPASAIRAPALSAFPRLGKLGRVVAREVTITAARRAGAKAVEVVLSSIPGRSAQDALSVANRRGVLSAMQG
jgi:hypothetical protein